MEIMICKIHILSGKASTLTPKANRVLASLKGLLPEVGRKGSLQMPAHNGEKLTRFLFVPNLDNKGLNSPNSDQVPNWIIRV